MKEKVFKLLGKVQNYAWGGFNFIPELLGLTEEKDKRYAEYWLGAHPSASSIIVMNDKQYSLQELIMEKPNEFLGEAVSKTFGELPYLLKVLDVKEMLSIQVHPSKEEAAKGFDAEETSGIAINAYNRNYKDKNHKPEVMVALSEFWLLHGFKQKEEILNILTSIPEFNFLLPVFKKEGYKGLYKQVMEMPQHEVDEVLLPLVKRELSIKSNKTEPAFWVKKLFQQEEELKNFDKGIFSIYFFNIVQVQPGEAVFQGAGIPHAYLEGQNVELMANSDNVLRGGLTPKHIDVTELLKHTTFEGIKPNVMPGFSINDIERNYPCPVADFGISSINISSGKVYEHTSNSAEIYLITEGSITLNSNNKIFEKGESFYVLPAAEVSFTTTEKAIVFKAFVP